VSFVCFMCPGMFNALTGLGGGGQVNTKDQANANAALYATFAFFGFFSGTINNILGPRLTLLLGTWGYSLYIAGFLVVNIHPGAGAFVITAGAILGVCAALLWTAQGSLMMAYPTEAQKGAFIGIFWAILTWVVWLVLRSLSGRISTPHPDQSGTEPTLFSWSLP